MRNYGIQMYSVRDITKDDMEGALKKLAEMGYGNVEFAGFFDIPAETIKGWLDKYGLKASGTHTQWKLLEDDFEGTVAYHKAIGCKRLIIPGADLSTKENLDAFIDLLNKYQPLLAAEGISLGYHNHDGEFGFNKDGMYIYDEIVNRTNIDLEIDTYWAYAGKQNPLALMERLKDRLHVIHIKDGFANREGKPLGQGTAPVAQVYKKAVEMGVDMVVESETLQPDGLTEAKICIDFLKAQE